MKQALQNLYCGYSSLFMIHIHLNFMTAVLGGVQNRVQCTEEKGAVAYFPFILLRGVDIIAPLSEIIGITQYTDSTPDFCQNLSSFSCQIFYTS